MSIAISPRYAQAGIEANLSEINSIALEAGGPIAVTVLSKNGNGSHKRLTWYVVGGEGSPELLQQADELARDRINGSSYAVGVSGCGNLAYELSNTIRDEIEKLLHAH